MRFYKEGGGVWTWKKPEPIELMDFYLNTLRQALTTLEAERGDEIQKALNRIGSFNDISHKTLVHVEDELRHLGILPTPPKEVTEEVKK